MKKITVISLVVILTVFLFACGGGAKVAADEQAIQPANEITQGEIADLTPAHESAPEPTPEPEPALPSFVDAEGSFELYGIQFNLKDETIQLSHVPVDDNGEMLLQVLPFMTNLKTVDMDSCGVDDEHMEIIRDARPDCEVIWRIWFGNNNKYSVRTNVEKILASNPGTEEYEYGLTTENSRCLKYCTKVKYLDLGHNYQLGDISFVRYMPDLEIVILAMAVWTDATPLSYCPKLEYAELQTSGLNDVTPLAKCTNLKHLDIAYCNAIWDITPLYDLDLERLWIGIYDPVPAEQVERYKELHPNCKVNSTSFSTTGDGWRYVETDPGSGRNTTDPAYQHVRDVFEYHLNPKCYSYWENDPLR